MTTLRTKLNRRPAGRRVWAVIAAVFTAATIVVGVTVINHRETELSAVPQLVVRKSGTADSGSDRPLLQLEFAKMPDGEVPQEVAGTALSSVEAGRSTTPLRVVHGMLRHGEPMDTDASSELVAALPAPLTRIGATVVFPPYSGSIALAAWDSEPHADSNPNGGVHIVVGPERWEMSVWDAEAGREVLSGGNYGPIKPDTPASFDVVRVGDSATLTTPDGRRHVVTDPRIDGWTGTYATWELYETQPGVTPAAISALWAS